MAPVGSHLFLNWSAWESRGADPCVVEVLRVVYHVPLLCQPPLPKDLIPFVSYSSYSNIGRALPREIRTLFQERDSQACVLFPRVLELNVRCSQGFWRVVYDH